MIDEKNSSFYNEHMVSSDHTVYVRINTSFYSETYLVLTTLNVLNNFTPKVLYIFLELYLIKFYFHIQFFKINR